MRKLLASGFFKKARVSETFLMTGFVLIAIPFLGPVALATFVEKTFLLFVSNFLLLVAVYSANSYFGYKADRLNPRLNANQFASSSRYLVMTLVSLAIAIGLLGVMNRLLPFLGFVSFLLWILYSAPGGAKSRPIWGTLVHLVGQVLQFHLCVIAFTEPTIATFAISIYFGLLFASGHLMHEVKDHESDAAAGIRTNSVVFGKDRIVRCYKWVVVGIPIYWIAIFAAGLLEQATFVPFVAASIAHACLTWRATPFFGEPGSTRYQMSYRILYLLAGGATFAITLAKS